MELDIVQAIELAIAHELEARKSYLALADEADDPEMKRLLLEIAQEEAGHEASLRSRLRLYQQKQLLRETISRYVSPRMVEEILKHPERLALGGQRRHVTVLFADIKAFTTLAEAMDPARVVEVLNAYFTEMVELVFEHEGTLDKYLGDGLFAFFGAPLEAPQAAGQAVGCALDMQKRLCEMRAAGRTPITGMRIGLNTGEAIVGNIGSNRRMDFTIIGDVVNIAARLLEVGRETGCDLVMSGSTFREVEGRFAVRPGPQVVLRGRREATETYLLDTCG